MVGHVTPVTREIGSPAEKGSLSVFKVKCEDNHIAQVKEDHKPQGPPVSQTSNSTSDFLYIISKQDFCHLFIFLTILYQVCFGAKFTRFTPKKRRGNKTPPLSLMSMERLCFIFCWICVSAVLCLATYDSVISQSPVQLHVRLGATAIFTCNLTALNFTPTDLNWYQKTNREDETKIADVQHTISSRHNLTTDWGQKIAVLRINNVTLNDSGQYLCRHVNFEQNGLILTSNTSELIVKDFNDSATTGTDQTEQIGPPDHKPEVLGENNVIAISILLVLLLLLLIGIATFLVWYKQRHKMPQPQLRHLEKPSQDADVYTVDYGVLDFGNNQPHRKSAEISTQEQVEYATIMFP
ncbi:LOW QUALITY PROTEIN: programmed cell death protein 1 [Mantella aurantiaca]